MPNERLALLSILLLSALLAVPAKAAVAPSVPPSAPPLPQVLVAAEADEGEDESSEDEDGDEEAAEDEECEADAEECEAAAAKDEECLLTAAKATVSAGPHADRLRVAIRYAAFRPAAVAVSYEVRSGGRSARIGGAQTHLGRKGVFHDAIEVSDSELSKVTAAREVAIGLHPLNTPGYCKQVFEQHLTPKRTGNRLLFA